MPFLSREISSYLFPYSPVCSSFTASHCRPSPYPRTHPPHRGRGERKSVVEPLLPLSGVEDEDSKQNEGRLETQTSTRRIVRVRQRWQPVTYFATHPTSTPPLPYPPSNLVPGVAHLPGPSRLGSKTWSSSCV